MYQAVEGLSFGDPMNALSEPDVRFLPSGGDQPPELIGDRREDAPPIAGPLLPEEPGAGTHPGF